MRDTIPSGFLSRNAHRHSKSRLHHWMITGAIGREVPNGNGATVLHVCDRTADRRYQVHGSLDQQNQFAGVEVGIQHPEINKYGGKSPITWCSPGSCPLGGEHGS